MFAYGSFEQELFWKINLNAYGGGSTPYVSLQSKGSSYNYYGLSLYRKFLKDDRLSVSIFAGDFLQKKAETYHDILYCLIPFDEPHGIFQLQFWHFAVVAFRRLEGASETCPTRYQQRRCEGDGGGQQGGSSGGGR